jgi:hypothetical protein
MQFGSYGSDQFGAGVIKDGFVRMLTSYSPENSPTYIDEGNTEMFVVEQIDTSSGEARVDQLHLTPNQAYEMREKLNAFLEGHFPNTERKPKLTLVRHSGMIAKAAAILPIGLLAAACKF